MYEYKRRKEIIPTKLKGLPGEFTGGQKHRQRSETRKVSASLEGGK